DTQPRVRARALSAATVSLPGVGSSAAVRTSVGLAPSPLTAMTTSRSPFFWAARSRSVAAWGSWPPVPDAVLSTTRTSGRPGGQANASKLTPGGVDGNQTPPISVERPITILQAHAVNG